MLGLNEKRIFIAGHRGLLGSAIVRELQSKKIASDNLLVKSHEQLDLKNREQVFQLFSQYRPNWVFIAAATVGGIHANDTYPVEFLLNNLTIQNNIIEAAYQFQVEKLMFPGSSCIYPKLANSPLKEEYLLTGHLEPTNESYAIAKIAGIKLCKAYNREYNTNYMAVMPCNLYGPNDNYHPTDSHVLPALLRRIHLAKINGMRQVEVWGSGKVRREFLFSDDLAQAMVFLMTNFNAKDIGEFINIGSGEDYSISEVVDLIKDVVGYSGEIFYNTSKPDGTPKKVLDVTRIKQLGWKATTSLQEGLRIAYQDFLTKAIGEGIGKSI